MGIGNNSDIVILQIDNQDGTKKKSYEEYVKDKAIYEGKLEAVNKFRSAGYSAADIGEGRLDSSLSTYASQIASMKTQASSLESNISSIDSSIDSAEFGTAQGAGRYFYFHAGNACSEHSGSAGGGIRGG